jgi:hypothetical protein
MVVLNSSNFRRICGIGAHPTTWMNVRKAVAQNVSEPIGGDQAFPLPIFSLAQIFFNSPCQHYGSPIIVVCTSVNSQTVFACRSSAYLRSDT